MSRRSITRDRPLFVFDGHCMLCSSGAAFIMKHDRIHAVEFASAQSELGSAIYRTLGMPVDESYLLIDQAGVHTKSEGYFRLAKILGGWWRVAIVGRLLPRPIRDRLYDLIARNRYRWFGRTEQCRLLSHEQRKRLISDDEALWAQVSNRSATEGCNAGAS